MKRMTLGLATLLASVSAYSADIPLYPTGPEQDAAFLRFANGTPGELKLVADGSKASLVLNGDKAVSAFLPVVGGDKPIKGVLSSAGKNTDFSVKVAPGEFATVVVLADAKGAMRQLVVREVPDDFNALKASLAFINADTALSPPSTRLALEPSATSFNSPGVPLAKRRNAASCSGPVGYNGMSAL